MAEKILDVNDLRVSFDTYGGSVKAVRGVSFHVNENETLAIVGESGCGKSVTMQTVMGLIAMPPGHIDSGSIRFRGGELTGRSDKEMQRYRGSVFSMIFQDSMTSLDPTMRVGKQMIEGIRRHQKLSRKEATEIAVDMLGQAGLPEPEKVFRRYPHTLSGGQRQRVMIAMALCSRPEILIADEPTTALDVTTQAQILDIMLEMKEKLSTSIILITHDLGVVARMADRIAVMYAGQIVETGTADEIFYNPCHPYTWGLIGSMPNLIQDVKEELYSIPGAPPDLFSPPKGCAFAARCEYCMKACRKMEPPEFVCSDGHKSKCWLMDDRAAEVRPPAGVTTVSRTVAGGKGGTQV